MDDAWIHQTYARNLAIHGQWAYIPGEPSGGSTSPLWTSLLAIGYLLRLSPYLWTNFLGWLCLWGLALSGEGFYRKKFSRKPRFPWVGTLLIFEWHLVWAAGSGMETLLFSMVATAFLFILLRERQKWFWAGVLVAATVWIRPDGVTLLGPLLLVILCADRPLKERFKSGGMGLAGFLVAFVPYLLFNQILAGSWWPNTFYAKQIEYASLQQTPILSRLIAEFKAPLVGVGAVLAPGLFISIMYQVKKHDWASLAGILWSVGYLGMYAWRLPVTYQHGRYLIPGLPILIIWSIIGYIQFSSDTRKARWRWIVSKAWLVTIGLILSIFWGLGARAYAQDVAIIETEMVDTARWVAVNIQPGSLIAAHDIGALGYFGNQPILDLAGLISPQVIPFMRDEDSLAEYMDEKQVVYLMTFPDWYTRLARNLEPIYQGSGRFAPAAGQANMRIYRWNKQVEPN
ncbi:MAG: hypothetical protein PHQ40_14195 [Anaerolineaceae bacterium]|nr:hypothetical protein [Anaerolineaceae bacterium]